MGVVLGKPVDGKTVKSAEDKFSNDIQAISEDGLVAVATSIGGKDFQQDLIFVGCGGVETGTLGEIVEEIAKEHEPCRTIGTTLCCVHCHVQKGKLPALEIANMGDSQAALLLKIKKPDGTSEYKLHSLTTPDAINEQTKKEIEERGGSVKGVRVGTSDYAVNMSSSIGDSACIGLRKTANNLLIDLDEIKELVPFEGEMESMQLLMSSDGFELSEEKLRRPLANFENFPDSYKSLARCILSEALVLPRDNISIITANICSVEQDTTFILCDGHGKGAKKFESESRKVEVPSSIESYTTGSHVAASVITSLRKRLEIDKPYPGLETALMSQKHLLGMMMMTKPSPTLNSASSQTIASASHAAGGPDLS